MKATPKKRHLLRDAIIAACAFLVITGVIIATPPIFFFNVTVTGTASVAKAGAVATGVSFVDENGVPYVAALNPTGNYSISLQNGHTYSVFVVYTGVDAAGGANCSAGSLDLNTLGWTQTNSWSC